MPVTVSRRQEHIMQWEMDDSEVAYGFAGLGDVWARNEMAVWCVCVSLTYSCCRIFHYTAAP